MTQKQVFYSSELSLASDNLRKMAQMQADAGMYALYRDSMRQAVVRDHARDYFDNNPNDGLSAALDYGEKRVAAGV